jgi:beta-glucanase (GH16 family)
VDIFEYFQRGNSIVQNLHWDGYGAEHKSVGSGNKTFEGSTEDYHVFAVEWKPDAYIFYIDGKESWRSSAKVSQVPGYIKLTDEVGDWAGNIVAANLPDYFLVDYVRVYQKKPATVLFVPALGHGKNFSARTGISPTMLFVDLQGRLIGGGLQVKPWAELK